MDSPFITLSCTSGTLHFDQKYTDFGITPSDSPDKNICKNNDITNQCLTNIDYDAVLKHITDTCLDKEMCQVYLSNLTQHLGPETPEKCKASTASFFIQG